MKTKSPGNGFAEKKSRRNFLLAAGLGSAGAVVTLGKPKVKAAGETAQAAEKSDGYRASEHVLKYYKTTEV